MDREQAKQTIKGYLEDYLRKKGINTLKPFRCLNPAHDDKNPSMMYNRKDNYCKCFSCPGEKTVYDIFDLIGFDYGLTDFKEQFDFACKMYGITIDGQISQQSAPAAARPKRKAPEKPKGYNYTNYLKKVRAAFENSPGQAYLEKRGISKETAEKFNIGYDSSFNTREIDKDGKEKYVSWRAVIIPAGSGYLARTIDTPTEPAENNKCRYAKGNRALFNAAALYEAEKPIFIVEGEIDALSIIEAGGEAVGLGGISQYKKLARLLYEKKTAQPLILALDADDPGMKTEEALAEDLTRLGIPFYRYNPYGGEKDANAALTADRESFISELRTAERIKDEELEAAREAERKEYLKNSAALCIQAFKDKINASAQNPAISTGFKNLDNILDGGLYEGLYFIGAMSSLGKTTLVLQMADNIAQAGQDVLIFSLEMSRYELMAKSVSRLTYVNAKNKEDAKTTRGIMAGARYEKYSPEVKELINESIFKYQEYAKHIFMYEGIGNIGVEKVKEIVTRHIDVTGNRPIVIIDYLQILAPYDLRASDKQNTDKCVLELKRLSRDFGIPVIGISSFNREAYKENSTNKGQVSIADFKESGAIEYSADVLIGLEFATAGTNAYSEREAKRENPRRIRLVVLKNRNGKTWVDANFNYHVLFNYFQEDDGFRPAPEATKDLFNNKKKRKAS